MNTGRDIFKLCVAVVLLVLCAASARAAELTAIKAGKLFDPDTGTTAVNQIMLIEGTTIKAVGPNVTIPPGATVIDLSRYTVLPGLFDAHSHMCHNVGAGKDQLAYPLANPTP